MSDSDRARFDSIRAARGYHPSPAGFFRANRSAVIGAFTYGFSRMRCGDAAVEKRDRMPSKRKLVFNIRISTEAEINGTVKGVV